VAIAGAFCSLLSCRAKCGDYACTPEDRSSRVEYVFLAQPPRPIGPRSPESVSVVVTAPRYAFVETALLEARQADPCCSTKSDVIQELRNVAARMGCDLVILFDGNDATYSYPNDRRSTFNGYRATCGVYYGAAGRPASSAGSAP
jgi:hypothetical protein